MGAIQGGPYGPALFTSGASHLAGHLQTKSTSQGPLPMIAPKPPNSSFSGHQNYQFGPYGQGQPVSLPAPPTYNFNQYANPSTPYPQPNIYASSQSQPGFAKTSHDPNQHHQFVQPQSGQNNDAYLTNSGPSTLETTGERMGSFGKPRDNTFDYELPEDDASMGDSDDETKDPREFLGPVVQRFSGIWDANGTRVRTFSTFAQCDVLSEYTATAHIEELKDPRMLAIFMHFIKVTGPSMSLYERHPFDHGDDAQFDPTPKGANNLWTCKWIVFLILA